MSIDLSMLSMPINLLYTSSVSLISIIYLSTIYLSTDAFTELENYMKVCLIIVPTAKPKYIPVSISCYSEHL